MERDAEKAPNEMIEAINPAPAVMTDPHVYRGRCVRIACGPRYCVACRDACPHGAICYSDADPAPRLDRPLCTACGECSAICPTEAWVQHAPSPAPVPPRCDVGDPPTSAPPDERQPPGLVAEIHCRRAGTSDQAAADTAHSRLSADLRAQVPCVLGVSGGRLAALLDDTVSTIQLHVGDCPTCPEGGSRSRTRRPNVLASLLPGVEVIADPAAGPSAVQTAAGHPWADARLSRKRLLGLAAATLAGSLLQQVLPNAADEMLMEEPGQPPELQRGFFLVRLRRAGTLPREDARLVGLGSLTATGNTCDGCGLCVRCCRLGALALGLSGLEFLPSACSGCGVCVQRCPHSVLAHADTVDLEGLDDVVILAPTPTGRCPCGALALADSPPNRPRCLSCSRAEELIATLRPSGG